VITLVEMKKKKNVPTFLGETLIISFVLNLLATIFHGDTLPIIDNLLPILH